ncbi:unnamed protein product [Gordionus sp. m RMFG-2023]
MIVMALFENIFGVFLMNYSDFYPFKLLNNHKSFLIFIIYSLSSIKICEFSHLLWETNYGLYEPSQILAKSCIFPQRWHGSWSQTTFAHNLVINHNEILDKGICLAQVKQRYLLYNEKQNCYQCLFITEKHYNVLQFKESFCVPKDTLQAICDQIGGDAFLYTLFRSNPSQIKCPFHHQRYKFKYRGEYGDCRGDSTVNERDKRVKQSFNSLDSCTNPTQLLFRFQSCPDLDGQKGILNFKLSCLAEWKDGNKNYLAGSVEFWDKTAKYFKSKKKEDHPTPQQAIQDKYRCFIYEKNEHGYHLSMSYDSTCFGIFSAKDGPHLFELTSDMESIEKRANCYFPAFFNNHKKWPLLDKSGYFEPKIVKISANPNTDLMNRMIYDNFYPRTHGGRSNFQNIMTRSKTISLYHKNLNWNYPIEKMTCFEDLRPKPNLIIDDSRFGEMNSSIDDNNFLPSLHKMIIYSIFGCFHGYKCLHIHRRSEHVIELQEGILAPSPELACQSEYFDEDRQKASIRFSTLAAEVTPSHSSPCPFNGMYEIVTARAQKLKNVDACDARKLSLIEVGCKNPSIIDIQHICTSRIEMQTISSFKCHAHWQENDLHYLISSEYHSKYLNCFIIKENKATNTLFISNTQGICKRNVNPEIDGIMRYHAVSRDICPVYSSSPSIVSLIDIRLLLIITLFASICNFKFEFIQSNYFSCIS